MTELSDLLAACDAVQRDANAAATTKAMAGKIKAWAPTVSAPVPPPAPGGLIRELDFSTGDTSQWLGDETGVGCKVAVVPGPGPHNNPYVAKFSVPGPTAGHDRNRAQVTLDTFDVIGNEGQEQWFADSFCIGSQATLKPNIGWNNLLSFHQWVDNGLIAPMHFAFSTDANGAPSLYLTSYGGNWKSTDTGDPANWIQYYGTGHEWTYGPIKKGQWYDVLHHVLWSPRNDTGWFETWINGTRWLPKTFSANQYTTTKTGTAGSRNYLKAGYDTDAGNGPSNVYHACTRIASDQATAEAAFQ